MKNPLPNSTTVKQVKKLNDLKTTRNPESIKETIADNSKPSLSFYALLMSSTIICTLGLLMDGSAVVIGGMIISPMMWPILALALGISYGQIKHMRRATISLLLAIALAFTSACLITLFSPIKIINAEILSRTEPTFLDVVVAIAAGAVAALAITHRRISSSLAGVAIATSLLPPLCVSAIGLALGEKDVFFGAFLLFAANVASILFVTTIVFSFLGLKQKRYSQSRLEGLLVTVAILILIANPLMTLLEQQSFEFWSYPKVNQVLEEELKKVSSSIQLGSTEVKVNHDSSVAVLTQIWLPDDTTINYQQQQDLVKKLETQLKRPINLKLNLQRTISVVSEADQRLAIQKKLITEAFTTALENYQSISLDSLQTEPTDNDQWQINAVIRSDLQSLLPLNLPQQIEQTITKSTDIPVSVQLEVIPRQTFATDSATELHQLSTALESALAEIDPQLALTSLKLKLIDDGSPTQIEQLIVQIRTPSGFVMNQQGQRLIRSLVDYHLSEVTKIQLNFVPTYQIEL